MAKTKQIKANEIVSTPKTQPMIQAKYKPLPKFHSGCASC